MLRTVTLNVPVVDETEDFVAVHSTVVVPNGNSDPDAGTQTTGTPGSDVALNVTNAPSDLVVLTVKSAGKFSDGGASEPMKMTNEPVATLACESSAEH